jgi:hypothetical protein
MDSTFSDNQQIQRVTNPIRPLAVQRNPEGATSDVTPYFTEMAYFSREWPSFCAI